ncbi:MAG: DUF5134 domain-containing protein [Ktedonobacteraceae bacterium]
MVRINPLSDFLMLLCFLIALLYLYRLVRSGKWLSHFDAENEAGHGLMAVGMLWMLAPMGLLTTNFLGWNILLFAGASLWWTCRLFVHKPLLSFLLRKNGVPSTAQSDAIHVFMHVGMCFMFLLMRNMAFSMMHIATLSMGIFFVAFACLTLFYGREFVNGFGPTRIDWLRWSTDLAHLLMSGIMCWMFFEMISTGMSMSMP